MPVKPEKFCFWPAPISSSDGRPPAFHAARITVFSSASVEVRFVPSVAAVVLPDEKPPDDPPLPRDTLVVIQLSKPPSLRGLPPDCAWLAWFCDRIASRSILMRRPASAVW